MSADVWKQQAAERALAYVEDGMTLGPRHRLDGGASSSIWSASSVQGAA